METALKIAGLLESHVELPKETRPARYHLEVWGCESWQTRGEPESPWKRYKEKLILVGEQLTLKNSKLLNENGLFRQKIAKFYSIRKFLNMYIILWIVSLFTYLIYIFNLIFKKS